MRQGLFGKAHVVVAKVAGLFARGASGMTLLASNVPATIKQKSAETAERTGTALRIGRLRLTMARWKTMRSATFAETGKTIFRLAERKTKDTERQDELRYLFSKGAKCEEKIRKTREQITEAGRRLEQKTGYREAILHLNSKLADVRFAAVQILGRLGNKKSIPILVKKLQDPDSRVRQQAAEFLHETIDRISLQNECCKQ